MKREAFLHPKLQLLARDLQSDLCYARGIIESLWLVAQNNFPQGDIGRWSDEEIAIAMGYGGDAAQLIAALCKRKLLDPVSDEDGRLYIHDWHVHCDDWVHMKLARTKRLFANGDAPKRSRLTYAQREKCAHTERTVSAHVRTSPSPYTEHYSSQSFVDTVSPVQSLPAPVLAKTVGDAADDALNNNTTAQVVRRERDDRNDRHPRSSSSSLPVKARGGEGAKTGSAALARKLNRKHPTPGSIDAATKAIEEEKLTEEQESEMSDSHGRWEAYWAREQPAFVPNLARWVRDGDWLRSPPDAACVPRKQPVSEMMRLAMEMEEEQREKQARRTVNGRAS